MNLRIRIIDDRHRDELYARRIEFVPQPPRADEQTSQGRVMFHTAWLHYRDNEIFAESAGPRIEHTFDQVMGRTWDVSLPDDAVFPMPTGLLMGGVMTAFDVIANEHLGEPALTPAAPPVDEMMGPNQSGNPVSL